MTVGVAVATVRLYVPVECWSSESPMQWRVVVSVPAAAGVIVMLPVPSVKLACPRTIQVALCANGWRLRLAGYVVSTGGFPRFGFQPAAEIQELFRYQVAFWRQSARMIATACEQSDRRQGTLT